MSIKAIIENHLAPLLQASGFSRNGDAFHRRRGATIQCIEIQRATESSMIGPKMFYINIGISFDELTAKYNKLATNQPNAFECDFHARLSDLVLNSPIVWAVASDGVLDKLFGQFFGAQMPQLPVEIQDVQSTGQRLVIDIRQILVKLDEIDSPQSFLQSGWKKAPSMEMLRVILLYVANDLDGAWQELQRVSRKFADREGMTVSATIGRLKLDKLKERLN